MAKDTDKKGGKSKQIQAAKASAKSGGKAKKKKWSKAKTKEKLANLVVFDKATYDKMLKEIPTAKLITTSVISDRLKVNGSLARKAIRELKNKGLIRQVIHHRRQTICTRMAGKDEKAEAK